MIFEWDEEKNAINKTKHRIAFEDAIYVYNDPLYVEIYDDVHSVDEDRWIIIGDIGEVVIVVVTYREENVTRLISARKATSEERRNYYE